jgi:hypothetical protein
MKAETTRRPALSGMRQRIPHEMHTGALQGGAEHAGDGRLQPLVRVRDHQLHAPQAAAVEEGVDPLVDLFAQPADVAPRHARHAERLHQIVDRPRRDAVDVGLL